MSATDKLSSRDLKTGAVTLAEDEDFPGTYDIVLGKDGWSIESHTCENLTCWCFQEDLGSRCGLTPERAQAEIVGHLRRAGQAAEAERVEALSSNEFLTEHGYADDDQVGEAH